MCSVTHTARVDPDAHRIAALGGGIVQIRLPMRGNPLRYVNAYAVEEPDGLTLVDCGWKTPDVLRALHEGLGAFGASLADVKRVVVTHFHYDHYGLAGTLRREGVEALGMHARDWEAAEWMLGDPSAAGQASDGWMTRNGFVFSEDDGDDSHRKRTELAQPTVLVEDGMLVGRLRALWTPGHSPGHLCFYDTHSKRVLSGDHILDPITPHVGLWIEHQSDPLGDYLASLQKMRELDATQVLPAHGEPFGDLCGRIEALLAHQARRQEQVLRALAHGPRTAAEVAAEVDWTRAERAFADLPEMQRLFAMAETLAHVQHARLAGRVVAHEAPLPITYALAGE